MRPCTIDQHLCLTVGAYDCLWVQARVRTYLNLVDNLDMRAKW